MTVRYDPPLKGEVQVVTQSMVQSRSLEGFEVVEHFQDTEHRQTPDENGRWVTKLEQVDKFVVCRRPPVVDVGFYQARFDAAGLASLGKAREDMSAGGVVSMSGKQNAFVEKAKEVSHVVQHDSVDAAYRTAARKIAERARVIVLAALGKKSHPTSAIVAQFLETDHGKALLSFALGCAPFFVGKLNGDARAAKLCANLRVAGLAHVTDGIADAVLDPITELFDKTLEGLVSSEAPEG